MIGWIKMECLPIISSSHCYHQSSVLACFMSTQTSAFVNFSSFSSGESKVPEDVQNYGTNVSRDQGFPFGFYWSCEWINPIWNWIVVERPLWSLAVCRSARMIRRISCLMVLVWKTAGNWGVGETFVLQDRYRHSSTNPQPSIITASQVV